jgi:hypothetical protein
MIARNVANALQLSPSKRIRPFVDALDIDQGAG